MVFGDYGRKIDLARKTGSLKGKVLMIRQGGNISVKEKVDKLFICKITYTCIYIWVNHVLYMKVKK